jgi:A/G-specific adenine glycosylase
MGTCNSYQLVVAELLLQRTRAEVVAGFFPAFVKNYPSWEALASEGVGELEEFLKPLGLWKRRAVALISLAKAVVAHGSELPASREELETLPAVGQYIANAVLTMCHGKKEPLLDVNMARLLERFFGPRKMADIRYDPYLQRLSRQVLSRGRAKELNWAMLDFAALICRTRSPLHNDCPLASECSFYGELVHHVSRRQDIN